ncbi:MAG: DUF3144 domain-containing protein [Asticcacaulis sp.]
MATSAEQNLFVTMASEHIDLANGHNADAPSELVALSLTQAAARYNAFSVFMALESKDAMTDARDEIVPQLTQQFRSFLEQHYDGFIADAV